MAPPNFSNNQSNVKISAACLPLYGLGYAIERPKSVTTNMLENWASAGGREVTAAVAPQTTAPAATV